MLFAAVCNTPLSPKAVSSLFIPPKQDKKKKTQTKKPEQQLKPLDIVTLTFTPHSLATHAVFKPPLQSLFFWLLSAAIQAPRSSKAENRVFNLPCSLGLGNEGKD